MKEKFNFIKNRKYNQIDWWIKYTQDQLRSGFSDNEDVSETIILDSVLNLNRYYQFLLIAIILGLWALSLYVFIISSFLLIEVFFTKELMSLLQNEFFLFLKLVFTSFVCLFLVIVFSKLFPRISKFKEINKRLKRLKDEKISRLISKEQIIASINERSFDLKSTDDLSIKVIKSNLEKQKGIIVKNEKFLIELLLLAMKDSSKDLIMRLCAIAQHKNAIEFKIKKQKEKHRIWLGLINNKSSAYGDSMIDDPYYLNESNPNRLKQNLIFLINKLVEAGLNDIAEEIESNIENAMYTNRTKKKR